MPHRVHSLTGSHYGTYSGAVVTATPFTMACWMRPDAVGWMTAMAVGVDGSNDWRWSIGTNAAIPGQKILAWARSATVNGIAQSTASYTTGVWQHACGVFTSATSRTIYRNGVVGATNTDSADPASGGPNVTRIGDIALIGDGKWSGALAHLAVWNILLTADEIAALARGVLPYRVARANLIDYWPWWGHLDPEPSYGTGRHDMAITGTTLGVDGPPAVGRKRGSVPLIERIYDETIEESTTPSLSLGTAVTANATLTESTTPGESLGPAVAANPTLQESITPGDTYAAVLTCVASIVEAITPSDTLAAVVTANAALQETVQALVNLNAAATVVVMIEESTTPGDSYFGGLLFSTTIVEAATPGDAFSGVVSVNALLEELAAPEVALSCTAQVFATLEELLTASASLSDGTETVAIVVPEKKVYVLVRKVGRHRYKLVRDGRGRPQRYFDQ